MRTVSIHVDPYCLFVSLFCTLPYSWVFCYRFAWTGSNIAKICFITPRFGITKKGAASLTLTGNFTACSLETSYTHFYIIKISQNLVNCLVNAKWLKFCIVFFGIEIITEIYPPQKTKTKETNKNDWLIYLFIVFNATFSNISAISWRPVLVVEEDGIPERLNHRPTQATGKLYHLQLRSRQCTLFVIYKTGCEPTPYWW